MMTLTLKNNKDKFHLTAFFALIFFIGSLFLTKTTLAQSSLTLSVSPTIYDILVIPEQEQKNVIRIINVNKKDLTVFLDVVNFIPSDDKGSVRFLPTTEDEEDTLASWIKITKEAVVIPAEQSLEVPFLLKIPKDAPPGGHYSAIMVGTKPFRDDKNQSNLQISQMVTSLMFVKVAGIINELGTIRDFYSKDRLVESPETTFELRFENKGNVYLSPRGEIKILNMWGEERGLIPVNETVGYGKVLQKYEGFDGIRKFSFSWKGEGSLFDIGRYKAVATLSYGTEAKQTATSETTFWVIPLKLIFTILISLASLVLIASWLIKIYIKKILLRSGFDIQKYDFPVGEKQKTSNSDIDLSVKQKFLDSEQKDIFGEEKGASKISRAVDFYLKNKSRVLIGLILFIIVVCLFFFIKEASTENRLFEVSFSNTGQDIRLSSEEIIYNELRAKTNTQFTIDKSLPILEIINRSGTSGVGAKVKLKLEEKGFFVKNLSADFSSEYKKTVVIYNKKDQEAATELSTALNQALLSAVGDDILKSGEIRIIIGGNFNDFSL